ncbi:MAG: hypothetical protein IH621_17355 [Krumholzibacteria bacterium]|nr:hypothetical protein [Candidatus Krumholzibacteria bacterium]
MRRILATILGACLLAGGGGLPDARASADVDMFTDIGLVRLNITNLGYIGHAFTYRTLPACEYPPRSHVEHIYRGGIWVGALNADGQYRVSTGSQDANGLAEGDQLREFESYPDAETRYRTLRLSSDPNSEYYDPAQNPVANQQFNTYFSDYRVGGSHRPLGLHVEMRTLAWDQNHLDDFVILDYAIVNVSGTELREVYLGFWIDTTVGNTEHTNPYDPNAVNRWNYYDDKNGAWGAQGQVPDDYTVDGDPGIWMAYEYDADGEQGLATSWIGYRLLGTEPAVAIPDGGRAVSYNQWGFRGVPSQDDWYYEGTDTTTRLPGKYQIMSNGDFDVGETQEQNFAREGNWVSLMSTGPFPVWAAGDTLHMTWAIVAGVDSLSLLANGLVAQVAYDSGFKVPTGPPSPLLEFGYADDSVILRWAPGDSLDAGGQELPPDSPERSPEHHISGVTGEPDFQGYRIYRYQGETIELQPGQSSPREAATLVAQFDIVDGIGFDTGLPPLNADGLREFTDTGLLEGFPYLYAVTSYTARSIQHGLEELESGFQKIDPVYPGPAPATGGNPGVGVYPNPYRAGSLYDDRIDVEVGRRIWFTNLPARCTIKIFTLAGDLVRTLEHDDPAAGQASWDLISGQGRAIASGLYVYAVEDLASGEVQRGKLVIVK